LIGIRWSIIDSCFQVNINECTLSSTRPCKFGECIDGINNYTCRCDPGYEGDDCDVLHSCIAIQQHPLTRLK